MTTLLNNLVRIIDSLRVGFLWGVAAVVFAITAASTPPALHFSIFALLGALNHYAENETGRRGPARRPGDPPKTDPATGIDG